MPLRPLTDTSPADWFVDSDVSWHVKVGLGPPGFDAYVRVLFDLDSEEPLSDVTLAGQVLDILGKHTATADNVYVGVWKGWGLWPKGNHPEATSASDFGFVERDYQLLSGRLSDALDPASLGLEDDSSSAVPHLIWPYDHGWFLAADVDPDWIGVGGSRKLIDEILGDDRFDAEATDYDASDWETR